MSYRAYLKRGDRRKLYGTVAIKVIEGAVITPDEGTTVYGQVICAILTECLVECKVDTFRSISGGTQVHGKTRKYTIGRHFIASGHGYEYITGTLGRFKLINTVGIGHLHTMGNHDNDMNATSDFDAEIRYRTVIAPTYYSFNIGKVHYVVLDDIDCSSYDGTDSRNYSKKIVR